ncbi:MAG TPA: endonuclease/exonuclease/phosphatase family protein [Pyrinomonadaceae bacterium]|nr:endonuclease/exonuclease/phosphatase family protein [Pyrinomonadaceae bacterium]
MEKIISMPRFASIIAAGLFLAVIAVLPQAANAQKDATIAEVQGDKAKSPLENQQVKVHGIVTALNRNGFFMQSPDDKTDGNPATSEGVYVYIGQNGSFGGAVGDMVEVTATVQEFIPRTESFGLTITELGKAIAKTLSSKNALPAPITLTTNDLIPNNLVALEKYEGMRVKVDTLVVTGPTGGRTNDKTGIATSDGVFFGTLAGVARPTREAGVEVFVGLGLKLPQTIPLFDTNPEMLRIDSDALTGSKAIDVTAGATLKNLIGVIDYSYRHYTLLVDAATPPTVEGNKAFTPVSSSGERELTIGSFNIENFFDDEQNSEVNKETMLSKEYFQKRLNKASLAIRKVLSMPDVLGVEEVENLKVLKKLAAKINADAVAAGLADPKYEAYLEDGNDIRGIDSGFLVKSTKVKVIDTKQLAKDVNLDFKEAAGDAKLFDRPPFMIRVQAIDAKSSDPLAVTVIVNHLKSYLGIDSEKDGPRVREKRKQEAEWLANFVAERAKADPNERMLVCGDFNAFLYNDGYNDLIGTLKGKPDQKVTNPSKVIATGLFDLADFIAPANKYSYVHDGSTQVLDHILVNKKLSDSLSKFGYARVDADFPVAWSSDDTRPERLSDHDAPVAFFSLDPKAAAGPAKPSN